MAGEISYGRVKDNTRRKGAAQAGKARRREEAEVRQKAYDALTVEQKLERLNVGGHGATKQRVRLEAQLAAKKGA